MRKPVPISSINDIPKLGTIAIVISLNTRLFTTLAVASAARNLALPILIVECQSSDGSYETLSTLQFECDTWILRHPARAHGLMIDKLMRELNADRVLLIDSDVEVLDGTAYRLMADAMNNTEASELAPPYGAGWITGGHYMPADRMPDVWFLPRSWIPFSLFDRECCAQLVEAGQSFDMKLEGNEFPVQSIANLLARRARYSLLCSIKLPWLRQFRKERFGRRAPFYFHDTGARLHEAALQAGYRFVDIGEAPMCASITHFLGATRRSVKVAWDGISEDERAIAQKLSTQFGISFD
jgi:hypothetical protein